MEPRHRIISLVADDPSVWFFAALPSANRRAGGDVGFQLQAKLRAVDAFTKLDFFLGAI